jgi:hypothetical protein
VSHESLVLAVSKVVHTAVLMLALESGVQTSCALRMQPDVCRYVYCISHALCVGTVIRYWYKYELSAQSSVENHPHTDAACHRCGGRAPRSMSAIELSSCWLLAVTPIANAH